MPQITIDPQRQWTATELRQLPSDMRDAILAAAAEKAADEYRDNVELTAFEAFGEKDLHVNSADTDTAAR